MRIVPRLSIVLVGAMSIALIARAWLQIDRDEKLFEADMRRDHRVVGHVLAASINAALAARDESRSRELIGEANATKDGPRFSLRSQDEVPQLAHRHEAGVDADQRVVQGEAADELVSYIALADASAGRVLEIRESLIDRDRYVRSDIRFTVAEIVAAVSLSALVAFLLSKALVGRPIEMLVKRAREIGDGDLTPRAEIEGPSELRFLSREIGAMCERLAAAHERLAVEADARVRAIDELRHAERLATVGRLAAGVAHELGTPLSVVAGHAQMIANGEVKGDGIEASARIIEQQVQRSSRIIRQLLDFARRKGPDGSSTDVLGLVTETINVLSPIAQKKKATLHVQGERLTAAIAPERLQQVVTNIILNALDALPPAGGRISIDVQAEDEREDHGVRISVTDTGTGIPEDLLPRIFEPFFTTKATGEGTGLGLSVVEGIVRDHGGRIDVQSSSERGTTVNIHLRESLSS